MFPIVTALALLLLAYTIIKVARRKLCTPDFANKNVWITGASSGIGQFLAYQFSRRNANLIITARNVKQLERVKSTCQYPDRVKVVPLDMTDFTQIQKVTNQVISELQSKNQKLDIVIENAGVSMRCLFTDLSFKSHLQMYDINVHGPFRHIQCLIKHMMKNKSGHIVGVTSASGKLATSLRSSYAGSKSAFIGILDSLRSEVAEYGIRVTNIMPGYVNTNLSKNAMSGGEGQKLGYTDQNIATGLDAGVFAENTARAIYMKQNQLQISKGVAVPFGIFIRNLCPDLAFFMMRKNHASQIAALQVKHE